VRAAAAHGYRGADAARRSVPVAAKTVCEWEALVAGLLMGSGLRLIEGLRCGCTDLDFSRHDADGCVNGKGGKVAAPWLAEEAWGVRSEAS